MPRLRKRLSPVEESKGHGFCQPASLFWILVTVSNFCLGNFTPTFRAWLELFGENLFFQVVRMQAWHHFCQHLSQHEGRRAKMIEERTDSITSAAGSSHA